MRRILVVVLLALALGGCDGLQTNVSGGGGSAQVDLHELPDGTRCAVLIGYSKAAMSCDWRR